MPQQPMNLGQSDPGMRSIASAGGGGWNIGSGGNADGRTPWRLPNKRNKPMGMGGPVNTVSGGPMQGGPMPMQGQIMGSGGFGGQMGGFGGFANNLMNARRRMIG